MQTIRFARLFLEDIHRSCNALKATSVIQHDWDNLQAEVKKSVSDHFSSHFYQSISTTSSLLESLYKSVLEAMEAKFGDNWQCLSASQDQLKRELSSTTFVPKLIIRDDSPSFLFGLICNRINYLLSSPTNPYTLSLCGRSLLEKRKDELIGFASLLPFGHMYQALAIVRNYVTHRNRYANALAQEADSEQLLGFISYSLDKISQCKLFLGEDR